MISKVCITGLKSIDKIELECSDFNLLVGTNSSGKSSAIQALLLVLQNIDKKSGLNGELISLGEFREVRNFNTRAQSIGIGVYDERLSLILTIKEKTIDIEKNSKIGSLYEIFNKADKHLKYISCGRIGAQDTYQKDLSHSAEIGSRGEYAFHYLMENSALPLESNLIKEQESFTLGHQVNHWLHYIVGANISVENIIGTDYVKAAYTMMDGKPVRPKNIGSGVSYIVSIIIMCLASKTNDVILIENPEIHLHPSSQSRVCEFLYFIAKSGRQVFVETHSDHFFNGVRAGIAANEMDSRKIAVNFFAMNDKNCSTTERILFGNNGKILNYRPDLFDQFDQDLDKMLGI